LVRRRSDAVCRLHRQLDPRLASFHRLAYLKKKKPQFDKYGKAEGKTVLFVDFPLLLLRVRVTRYARNPG
jgi:hypothetical protein